MKNPSQTLDLLKKCILPSIPSSIKWP